MGFRLLLWGVSYPHQYYNQTERTFNHGGSPYELYVVWLQPVLQPVLRVGAGPQADPQEALRQWAVEGAWVGALPLGVGDPAVAGGLEDQPWVLELQPEVPQRA